MNLFGSGLTHHVNNFSRGGAAHNAVIHQHDNLAFQLAPVGVMFQLDPQMADLVRGFDEGPAHIMIADNAQLKRNTCFLCVADGRRRARIRDRDHKVCIDF